MKNRIFKDSPFFDEAAPMPVDKDVFAFRIRQSNDFACSCSGTESFLAQIQKIESFSDPSTIAPLANAFRGRLSLSLSLSLSLITRAEGLWSNGLAE
jgi:hypothetical protein